MADATKKASEPETQTQTQTETRKERLARLASVRSRASSLDLGALSNPDPNMHYELVHNDDISITKKKILGFDFVSEQQLIAKHGGGDKNVIGDTVLMAIPKDVKEDFEYLDKMNYERKFGRQDADRNIVGGVGETSGEPLPEGLDLVEESRTRAIDGNDLKTILGKG